MNAEYVRARLMGTSPAAVEAAENRKQQERAEDYKEKARQRELPRWFDERFGARKPMKSFDATVVDITAEERTGTYQGGERAGQEYTMYRGIIVLDDVTCYEGEETSTIEFAMPEPGKDFSRFSEAAIMVRKNELPDIFGLVGSRWHFEGNWEPTFTDAKGFWKGTYYFDVTKIETAAKPAADPKPESATKLVEFMAGNDQKFGSELTAWLTRALVSQKLTADTALQSLVTSGKFPVWASTHGLLAVEDGKYVAV
ncbi:MAG: hypothetical protein E6Q97_05350 [Desulfurellales bacterium]|nr:MAG: hypothetical protein E6Q97_05350 [Desulfurellales bacterium]